MYTFVRIYQDVYLIFIYSIVPRLHLFKKSNSCSMNIKTQKTPPKDFYVYEHTSQNRRQLFLISVITTK